MKIFKRVISVFISILILGVSLPINVCADNVTLKTGRDILLSKGSQTAYVYIYDILVDAFANSIPQEKIDIVHSTYTINSNDLKMIYNLVRYDHPEYFWLTGSYLYGSTGTNIVYITPKYSISGSALENAKKELDDVINDLTCDLDGKSEYDKSKILHDRLCETVTYKSSSNDQTAYGALVEGKAVCAGYANAYNLLLKKVGMQVLTVFGSSYSPMHGQYIGHAWNAVVIDGEYYYTDVTWDDQNGDVYYSYLNVTSAVINEDHIADSVYDNCLPTATSTECNYYYRNNLCLDAFEVERIIELMKVNGYKTQVWLTGDSAAFEEAFWNNADYIADNFCANGYLTTFSTIGQVRQLSVQPMLFNHIVDDSVIIDIINADCTNNGSHTEVYYCMVCGIEVSKETVIDYATGHIIDEPILYTRWDATCTNNGLQQLVYECKNCDYVFDFENITIPARGHSLGEVFQANNTAASCINEGYYLECANCSICNKTITLNKVTTTPRTEHVYSDELDTQCNFCGFERHAVMLGDLDRNNVINNKDLGLLIQKINGWNITVVHAALDANCDGKVNNKDFVLLIRYINGWNIKLG